MAANEVVKNDIMKESNEEVIQHLCELFGNVLDLEIIQSVALSCNCNLERTSNILIEMSSSIGAIPKTPKDGKKKIQKPCITTYATVAHSHQARESNNTNVSNSEKSILSPLANSFSIPSHKKITGQVIRKSKKEQEFDRVVLHVRQGFRVLILMRGLPGSGKSYLAKQIVDRGVELPDYHTFILSSDDYFTNRRTGIYEYNRNKLQEAHESNHRRAFTCMSKGISPVIIDNTNSQMWEMKTYATMATNFGYRIEIVEPFTPWAFNEKELARRNRHGVPRAKIKEMLERFEKNVTPPKLLAMYSLSYNPHCKPPVNRTFPPIVYDMTGCNGIPDGVNNSSPRTVLPESEGNINNGYLLNIENKTSGNADLMDFENELVYISDDEDNNKFKPFEEPNSLDSILMCSPINNAGILKPSLWQRPDEQNFAAGPGFSEPEMKKARTNCNNSFNDNEIKSSQESLVFKNVESSSNNLSHNSETKSIRESIVCKNLESVLTMSDCTNHPSLPERRKTNKPKTFLPNLDLSSWGLPENAMSSWQSWDVVTPINGPEIVCEDIPADNSKYRSPTEQRDATTNTFSSDFTLVNEEQVNLKNLKVLKATSRDISVGILVTPPMSPPKRTLLDKSSMTNDDVLSAALFRERSAATEKYIEELEGLFPNIPVDYLRDVCEKCKNDLNWAVDLLLDDNKEIPQSLKINESVEGLDKTKLNQNDKDTGNLPINLDKLSIANSRQKGGDPNDQQIRDAVREVTELKRHLEENVEIDKNFYSDHILKIKNQRRRIISESSSSHQLDKPTTSKSGNFDAYFTSKGEVIATYSDVELDDFEPDADFPQNEDGEEEMVELNLGDACVSQLEAKFGLPDMFPQGFQPVVQVPAWLAGQLHAFYVESVFGQLEAQNQVLEMIVREDEELARKLQTEEEKQQAGQEEKTPNLLKIMQDEHIASSIYKKQTEEWKKLTPDTLAAKLTRQKLFTAFPTVDETTLTEILYAHGNSYEQTIEVLLASTDQEKIFDPDGTIREPPITEAVVNEMKLAEEESKTSSNAPDVPKSATEYREEANIHHRKHNELIQKAQQAIQRKQYPVAQFYSDLAKTYTQLYDQANGLAAAAFLDEHSKKLQNYHTLDLHYLYVKEAIEALDMFIDNNIRLLHGSNKRCENLFIITGRGKRSDQGKSRLKPAVMSRLRKRDIWYCEMNPGLLKIRVRATSAITSNLA